MSYKDPADRRKWEQDHREERRAYFRNRDSSPERRGRHHEWRRKAILQLANFWSRPIECMKDITPIPLNAATPCEGPIQIDHIHGGGRKDWAKNSWRVYRDIARGVRNLTDYRLLCRHHNSWNAGLGRWK